MTEAAALVVQILPIRILGLLAEARAVLVDGRREVLTYLIAALILLTIELFVWWTGAILESISSVSPPADYQLFGAGYAGFAIGFAFTMFFGCTLGAAIVLVRGRGKGARVERSARSAG